MTSHLLKKLLGMERSIADFCNRSNEQAELEPMLELLEIIYTMVEDEKERLADSEHDLIIRMQEETEECPF